jgi:hypothetical protein
LRGGYSIDRDLLIAGSDCLADEELTDARLADAMDFYLEMWPRVVLSHEAPLIVCHALYGAEMITSRTATALWRMFQAHEPARWFYGHHHMATERQIG